MSTNATSAITEAFWRRKQQGVIGAKCTMTTAGVVGTLALKASSADAKTTTVIGYSVAATGGKTYTLAATATIDISALTAHANNPNVAIDGTAADNRAAVGLQEFARRNAAGSIIPAGEKAYVVFTVDNAGTVHAYAGQSTTGTAYRPQLDLFNEAAFGELLVTNGTGADYPLGGAVNLDASNITVAGQDTSGVPVAD